MNITLHDDRGKIFEILNDNHEEYLAPYDPTIPQIEAKTDDRDDDDDTSISVKRCSKYHDLTQQIKSVTDLVEDEGSVKFREDLLVRTEIYDLDHQSDENGAQISLRHDFSKWLNKNKYRAKNKQQKHSKHKTLPQYPTQSHKSLPVPILEMIREIHDICDTYASYKENEASLHDLSGTQNAAARILQNFWRSHCNRRIFQYMKARMEKLKDICPKKLLRPINSMHADMYDKSSHSLVFRLAGESFPPLIVYRIYTIQSIINMAEGESTSKEKVKGTVLNAFGKKQACCAWLPFYSYRCSSCRSTSQVRLGTRGRKKKQRKNNYISWIRKMCKE